MQRIGGRTLLKGLIAAALLAGCGNNEELPAACRTGERTVTTALASAPGPVRLDTRGRTGGTPISDCMTDAADASDLQSLGIAVTGTAAKLADVAADRPDSPQAVRLGYLVGAVHRGSKHSQGLHAELVRRLDLEAGRVDQASPGFRRGERAGLRLG